jgi:cystathionine beta-lyase/cystathionine gamma-synthase
MQEGKMTGFVKGVLENMPTAWLNLTTHRLDIYDEKQAKTQFLEQFDALYKNDNSDADALNELPTAYDYIRLGHPLSCILEWYIAGSVNIRPQNVISFDSQTVPVMAILRKNSLENKNTQINYVGELPEMFDPQTLKNVYGYNFELNKVNNQNDISSFDGSTIFISQQDEINAFKLESNVDFYINYNAILGSVLVVNGSQNNSYISEIQHVRRRETIAMTPSNCLLALRSIVEGSKIENNNSNIAMNKASVIESIKTITEAKTKAVVASSGLSMQYAIVMGLIHDAQENHPGKAIKIIVPPNCYGGTNDQARRVAACIDNVEVMDLPVDGGNDMVKSIGVVLDNIAKQDAVPYIIAEIPTNPRVEVPDMQKLKEVLSEKRITSSGETATEPVFILDQTFCPNVHFLSDNELLSTVRTISYVSGSKFPSGGLCTAGYCAANSKAAKLMEKIEMHLLLCDNEATVQQYEFLAKQIPSMNQRIHDAYINTREFVSFITRVLPSAKINFVSEELAAQGFTPSVFSLDLPTKGNTHDEREMYKRDLNLKLIDLMITEIPNESKYCVSYGQLKGCYWTIPATSTQGTTKEGDKDYIARVALSANMDLGLHKKVFLKFVESL